MSWSCTTRDSSLGAALCSLHWQKDSPALVKRGMSRLAGAIPWLILLSEKSKITTAVRMVCARYGLRWPMFQGTTKQTSYFSSSLQCWKCPCTSPDDWDQYPTAPCPSWTELHEVLYFFFGSVQRLEVFSPRSFSFHGVLSQPSRWVGLQTSRERTVPHLAVSRPQCPAVSGESAAVYSCCAGCPGRASWSPLGAGWVWKTWLLCTHH